jgi:hypothetical protein
VSIYDEIAAERARQDARFGTQSHPDGTGSDYHANEAALAKRSYEVAFATQNGTWRHVLAEEVAEAFAESDPTKLRAELVQVAAVAVAWCQAIDTRAGGTKW